MNFDKPKAMRNAEKYVAQGKIRAAISEYQAVVENDPRDIATLNMLGDLHAKNRDSRDAIACYLQVAKHYSNQGFAHKAIAIYNKITRLQPDLIEVSLKLAELYKTKGSLSEARTHYMTLAEHYQSTGRRLEALAMWKQIALLDPNNTEVCMNLAESYLREGHRDDACEAFAEAGVRFVRQGRTEEAIQALMKGHELRPSDLKILDGLVKAYSEMGRVSKAVGLLEEILEDEPYNRDVLYLLVDCHIDAKNAAGAEKAVIKLVELEPANYPKLLELVRIYLNANDPDSAARILSMSSEYLLAGGQGDECGRWIHEILERDQEHPGGLRLLIRYCSWSKDERGYADALARLADVSQRNGAVDDERFALSNLTAVRPAEASYATRLEELNAEHGFEADPIDTELIRAQFEKFDEPGPDEMDITVVEQNGFVTAADVFEQKLEAKMAEIAQRSESNGNGMVEHVIAAEIEPEAESTADPVDSKLHESLESVKYYVENGYEDLANKTVAALIDEYGEREDIIAASQSVADAPADTLNANTIGIDEIRSEFGLEEPDAGDNDYDTHYHMAVAYQEMGLMEQAIREFQDAINLTRPDDGTRRFFQCANLLGHCFMEDATPSFAVTWYRRALETPELSDEEQQGLWYELGLALEAEGDVENSLKYFEMVYAENVDFRDVSKRVKHLLVSQ